MGNETSSTARNKVRTVSSDPNLVTIIRHVSETRQQVQSLEREIQNKETIITNKDITINSLTKANENFKSENCALENEKLHLTLSKNELWRKCEQLEKHNKTLKSEMEECKSVSDILTKANNKLQCENSTLKNQKLRLTQSKCEMKNKCEQLKKHNETLKSELTKYKSVPMLKQIQDLFENLQVLQRDIKKTETNIIIDEESMKSMVEKIFNKKKENEKKDAKLKQKSLDVHQIIQLTETKEQIIKAEKTLETINIDSHSFLDYKQHEVMSITERIKTCTKEFDSISDNINKIEEQLQDCKKELIILQNKCDQITRPKQAECEKILTLLDKQYTILWNLLYLGEPSASHLEKNPFLEDENISEINESEGVFVSADGKKDYAIMLYNLEEGADDQQKVFDIIDSICSISTKEIEVQRLGAHTKNKTRPIKVSMPTFLSVSVILSNKWKLRKGDYQHIRIERLDKKRSKTKCKKVQNEKSATFAYLG